MRLWAMVGGLIIMGTPERLAPSARGLDGCAGRRGHPARTFLPSDHAGDLPRPSTSLTPASTLGRSACSLDHLVGAYEKCLRNAQANRLCGLEVDRQFEASW